MSVRFQMFFRVSEFVHLFLDVGDVEVKLVEPLFEFRLHVANVSRHALTQLTHLLEHQVFDLCGVVSAFHPTKNFV